MANLEKASIECKKCYDAHRKAVSLHREVPVEIYVMDSLNSEKSVLEILGQERKYLEYAKNLINQCRGCNKSTPYVQEMIGHLTSHGWIAQ